MKKIAAFFIVILILYSFIEKSSNNVIIPEESIRFRIIANSNNKEDQDLKLIVKEQLTSELSQIMVNSNNIEKSRKTINENLPTINNIVNQTLKDNNSNQTFQLNYGQNYFPKKKFKGVIYPEGTYESLVISLGEAKGENWWCVLFPPLCLIDAQDSQTDEVEYQLFIKKIIDKFSKE